MNYPSQSQLVVAFLDATLGPDSSSSEAKAAWAMLKGLPCPLSGKKRGHLLRREWWQLASLAFGVKQTRIHTLLAELEAGLKTHHADFLLAIERQDLIEKLMRVENEIECAKQKAAESEKAENPEESFAYVNAVKNECILREQRLRLKSCIEGLEAQIARVQLEKTAYSLIKTAEKPEPQSAEGMF